MQSQKQDVSENKFKFLKTEFTNGYQTTHSNIKHAPQVFYT